MATALYRFPAITDLAPTAAAAQPAVAVPSDELEQIALAPLSAGDIIDRAVRLYRLQLLAFIRIVLPPTLLAYAGSILWTMGWRNLSFEYGDWRMFLMSSAVVLGGLMWVIGKAGFLMVMGASARALVFHFFKGTPVLARDVYRAVRERFWGLLGATIMLAIFTIAIVFMGYLIFGLTIAVYMLAVLALTPLLPNWLMMLMHFVFGVAYVAALIACGLIAYARVVYTPQAMMVEGKGVFEAFGRSFTLAGREFKRIGAVLLFQLWVAAALSALLLVPLGWYSYFFGKARVSLWNFFDGNGPLWFSIAEQTLTQIGEILIAPIVLLSFTLLYLDSRVRKEGFDVEMLANRVLPQARSEMKAAPPVPNVSARAINWSKEEPAPSEPELLETITIELAPVTAATPTPVETAARFCPTCGAAVNERARFCSACGGQL